MQLRPTQSSSYAQVQRGLRMNLALLARAQQQIATGLRIERPSDDPTGAARALDWARRLAGSQRHASAAETGRARLDLAATRLQDSSDILSEARALLVQGVNGTLGEGDRAVLAEQVRILRDRLLESANASGPEGYLFGGTAGGSQPPFRSGEVGGRSRVAYGGDGQSPALLVGEGLLVEVGLPGSEVFAQVQRTGTQYAGFTGVAAGAGGDAGTGFAHLTLRHDGTSGALGAGLAFVAGAADTILGEHTLVVDAAAGTVQLDGGEPLTLPPAGDPGLADVTVSDEHGAELHLDFSGWTGVDVSATVEGAGSISLDGSSWTALDFSAADLELRDEATGTLLHVDTRGIHRSGSELVVFGGAVNAFDTLQGIADDLDNVDGLPVEALQERLALWLGELDRNHDNVVGGLGVLGGRSARLDGVLGRLIDETTDLTARRSAVVDTDYSQAALEMTRAEQTLQLAQATGARLLSTTLLDFLR
jgi:flagellin-like hook-associated protein FlgL